MSQAPPPVGTQPKPAGPAWPQVMVIVVVTVFLTLGALWLAKTYIVPSEFTPVTLNPQETRVLEAKIERLEQAGTGRPAGRGRQPGVALTPEPYDETGMSRVIAFNERELNALLARNTNLAQRVALDLSDKLISAKILIPVDEDMPVLGGRILRIRTGVSFDFVDGRPVVKLKGVSLMGVPLPNAWLGGLKNVDLVAEFGDQGGFWQAFAAGVADLRVEEGRLQVELRE